MKKISILIIGIFLINLVSAAYWVDDPADCPTEYQAQTCSGSDVVCGYYGGVTFCYNPNNINPPTSSKTSTIDYTTKFNGGYLIDCYAYDGSAPYCNNYGNAWCDRSSTCYNVHRYTVCTANQFGQYSCGSCISNYFYCDGSYTDADGCEIHAGDSCGAGTGTIQYGECYSSTQGNCTRISDYLDCDNDDFDNNEITCNGANGCEVNPYTSSCNVVSGFTSGNHNHLTDCSTCECDSGYLDCDGSGPGNGNGCEVQDGGSCSIGGLSGTYDGCTCVVDKSYFETGTFIEYQTNSSQGGMLWFKDYNGNNWLINISNVNNDTWAVNSSGCIKFMDDTWQCTAYSDEKVDDRVANLMQDSTNLYWIYDDNANTLTLYLDPNPTFSSIALGTTTLLSPGKTKVTTGTMEFECGLKPKTNDHYDLGSSSYRWRNLYISNDISVLGTGSIGNIGFSGTTISTDETSLTLEQTGDTYGTTRLVLRNRAGSNGAIFESPDLDLVDFGFNPSSNVQSNLRLEHRSNYLVNSGNTDGEFQFIGPSGTWTIWFATGTSATTINAGSLYSVDSYSDAVGGTNRDLYIDSSGKIGYLSSSIDVKTNIRNISDTIINKLMMLRPVIFDRIDNSSVNETGLIAEEVEKIFPELVSYKRNVIWKNVTTTYCKTVEGKEVCYNMTERMIDRIEITDKPETVRYSKLPTLLLKAFQVQRKKITELNQEIESLNQTIQLQQIEIKALKNAICRYHPTDKICLII